MGIKLLSSHFTDNPYYIEWWDACTEHGWMELEELKDDNSLTKCVTLGFIVKENEHCIVVSHTVALGGFNSYISIPTKWVILKKRVII